MLFLQTRAMQSCFAWLFLQDAMAFANLCSGAVLYELIMLFNNLSAFANAVWRADDIEERMLGKNPSQPVEKTLHSEKYLSKSLSDSHFL